MTPTVNEGTGVRRSTLASLLHDSMVDWDVLDKRYRPLLRLVDALLGVVPNCDRYLEIWPPAFRTYNVMVPNLLNLPVPVFGVGGPPPAVIGLAMYVASRTAECPYCSAHSCSFAMRRGATAESVASALVPDRGSFTRGELAAIAVARSLARVPCELTAPEKAELIDVFGERRAEWIVLSVVMMGFLNKFMDATGIELEQTVVDEVSETMGPAWSPGHAGADLDPNMPRRPAPPADGWRTRVRLLPLLPAAIAFDRRVQRSTPHRTSDIRTYLAAEVGHDFPAVMGLRSGRARRCIATILLENLDASNSVVGLDVKVLIGAVFAAVVGDGSLAGDMRALAGRAAVDDGRLDAAAAFAQGDGAALDGEADAVRSVLALGLAASPSPAAVDARTVEACERAALAPQVIVETVTWLGVLQLLHRLTCYTTT